MLENCSCLPCAAVPGAVPNTCKIHYYEIYIVFLKSILNQKEESRIFQFVKLQQERSTKGDWIWISSCLHDLKVLSIFESLE